MERLDSRPIECEAGVCRRFRCQSLDAAALYRDAQGGTLMALVVIAQNISELAPVSDYDVSVWINERVIWRGKVTGHVRDEGWAELMRKIAEAGTPKGEK